MLFSNKTLGGVHLIESGARTPFLLGQMCRMGKEGGKLELGERVGQGNFICFCKEC